MTLRAHEARLVPGQRLLERYGMTDIGDRLFRMSLDGATYEVLYDFAEVEGATTGGLTLVGNTLYGTRSVGGQFGKGFIFAYAIPEPSSIALAGLGVAFLAACGRQQLRRTASK